MSQTVVLEQTVETHTQSITLKFDDYASNTSNDANSKPDSENQSITIKSDDRSSNPIPIPDVDSQTEAAVNEFLRKHDSSDDEEARTNARRDLRSFIDRLEIGTVLVLVKFASGVNCSELLDVLCEKVADVIKDKSVEEVREIFNITNDFTPEEEQAVRDEHPWAFED